MLQLYPRQKLDSTKIKVIAHGNSLTYGSGASSLTTKRWTDQAAAQAPLLTGGIGINNQGVGAQSIITLGSAPSTMVGTLASAVTANLSTTLLNVIVAWEAVNELTQNGFSVATTLNGWKTYSSNLRTAAAAAGAKVFLILATNPPARSASLSDADMITRNRAMKTLNAMARQSPQQFGFDMCWDIAGRGTFLDIYTADTYTLAEFQASGYWARNDGTADDFIHFGDAGYAFIAKGFSQDVKRVRPVR